MLNKNIEKYGQRVVDGINDISTKRDIKGGITEIIIGMDHVIEYTNTEEEINYVNELIDVLNDTWKKAIGTGRPDKKIDEVCQEWKDALSKKMCDSLIDELDNNYDQVFIDDLTIALNRIKRVTDNSTPIDTDELALASRQLNELEDYVVGFAGKKMSQEQADSFLHEIENQRDEVNRIFRTIDEISNIGGLGL